MMQTFDHPLTPRIDETGVTFIWHGSGFARSQWR